MRATVTREIFIGKGNRQLTRFSLDPKGKQKYAILIVDDEALTRKLYQDILLGDGYVRVYAASNEAETRAVFDKTTPDLVIMDLNLGRSEMDGLDLMTKIVSDWGVPVHFIVASGSFGEGFLREAMRRGAVDYIFKGNPEELNGGRQQSVVDELKFKVERALTYNVEVANFASLDPLTHLSNKATMYAEATKRICEFLRDHRTWKEKGFPTDTLPIDFSLALIDIDDFKKYNDTWGHMEGDYALKRLANFLRTNLRRSDTVCRFGGEELVMILPRTTFPNALGLCTILSQKFSEINFKPTADKTDVRLSFSTGIATWNVAAMKELETDPATKALLDANTDEAIDALVDATLKAADRQLYKMKERKKAYGERGRVSSDNGFLPADILSIQ